MLLHSLCVCACSLKYPACNAHGLYCNLWPARLYNFFFILSLKRHGFRKKNVMGHKNVLVFSTIFLRNISHSKRKLDRYDKNAHITSYSCPSLMEHEFSRHFFNNAQISNFTKIHAVGAELFLANRQADGRTDRHHEANSRFSHFCKRTSKRLQNLVRTFEGKTLPARPVSGW